MKLALLRSLAMQGHSPEVQAALNEIDAVVRRHAAVLQPTHEDAPPGEMLLDRIMLVSTWTDTDGDEWIMQHCEPKVSDSSTKGTLFRLLYEND